MHKYLVTHEYEKTLSRYHRVRQASGKSPIQKRLNNWLEQPTRPSDRRRKF